MIGKYPKCYNIFKIKLKIVMNKHTSNKIKENSNTVRHLIMGQIITTQNLVAIKEVRHAGQWVNEQNCCGMGNYCNYLTTNVSYHHESVPIRRQSKVRLVLYDLFYKSQSDWAYEIKVLWGIWYKKQLFSFKKIPWKVSSAKCRQFCTWPEVSRIIVDIKLPGCISLYSLSAAIPSKIFKIGDGELSKRNVSDVGVYQLQINNISTFHFPSVCTLKIW